MPGFPPAAEDQAGNTDQLRPLVPPAFIELGPELGPAEYLRRRYRGTGIPPLGLSRITDVELDQASWNAAFGPAHGLNGGGPLPFAAGAALIAAFAAAAALIAARTTVRRDIT